MQPANTTTIVSGSVLNDGIEAFAYIGSDQRLYLMVQQANPGSPYQTLDVISQWQSEVNITVPFARPGAGPRGDGPIAMNALQASVMFFLFEIDQDNHIQALPYPIDDSDYETPGWPPGGSTASALYPDLTVRTGAPPAASGSSIASYAFEAQKSQYVVYVGTDGNIWELSWSNGQHDPSRGGPLWQSTNLSGITGFTGVLAPKSSSPLAATMFAHEGSGHVFYIAGDNTIRELYSKNGAWAGTNLSEATGAKPPATSSPLTAFTADYENTLHVVYLGADGAVHELWWANGWQQEHTISGFGGAAPASDTALVGYASEFEQSHHVIYIDVNNAIQELYRKDGSWNYTNLTLSAGSGATPPLSTASPLAGHTDEGTKVQHVFYLDNRTRVHELYRHNNQWIAGQTSGDSGRVRPGRVHELGLSNLQNVKVSTRATPSRATSTDSGSR